jgi:hypothetical protein
MKLSELIKRKELVIEDRLLNDSKDIAIYNAKAYDEIGTGMELIKDADKWVPPKVEGYECREKAKR